MLALLSHVRWLRVALLSVARVHLREFCLWSALRIYVSVGVCAGGAGLGARRVDVLLQPSWTWRGLGSRHFEGDALRAVENGFNYLRCSSDGESGVVTARGQFVGRRFTGHAPTGPAVVFSLPLHPRIETAFTAGGYIFEWLVAAAAALTIVFAYAF